MSNSNADLNGTLVWIPCAENVWKQAEVVRQVSSEEVEVKIMPSQSGEDATFEVVKVALVSKLAGEKSKNALPISNDFSDCGVEDMCSLNHLHEPAVLRNLQLRFQEQLPYTYTGQICIAVNPYQWLELYDKALYQMYLSKPRETLPPHPFALSATAYKDMIQNGKEQSILVSGESGAGKTETVKILMDHLASVSGVERSETIDKVLKSNPLLESFGNAKTKRNDNSSRFGKFAQLQFDSSGCLIGARCETYLLEKSRVVTQMVNERSFHIFYQILSLPKDERTKFCLEGNLEDYDFVNTGTFTDVDGHSDREQFNATKDAMRTIGMESAEISGILEIVAAILNLGQIKFELIASDGEEKSQVANTEFLELFAKLMKTDALDLHKILCLRTMQAGAESYSIPLNAEQALNLRDAFAKGIYSYLFDWLVSRVNRAICSSKQVRSHIGLLDIFGFESFEHNSFEQLCINYANEKLQQKFNVDVFKTVQAEYMAEGLPLELITFEDNQPILDLMEGSLGIVSLLNEEVLRPMATDASFVSKVLEKHGEHQNLESTKFNRMFFVVHHYAGEVTYDGEGFLEKNKDTLPTDLVNLLSSSESTLVREVFSKEKDDGKYQGYLVGNTIAGGFRKQLSELMGTIGKTSVQYVRCIKPNDNKSSTEFDRIIVAEQLRCAGVISAIRISRASFPNRLFLHEFQKRFQIICPPLLRNSSPQNMVLEMMKILLPHEGIDSIKNSHFAVGKNRVYFSSGLLQKLDEKRFQVLRSSAIVIQKNILMCQHWRRFNKVRRGAILLQSACRKNIDKRNYRASLYSVVRIQSVVRGFLHRKLYAKALERHMDHKNSLEVECSSSIKENEPLVDDKEPNKVSNKGTISALSVPIVNDALLSKVDAAEAAAREAQLAVTAASNFNKELRRENEALQEKLASNMAEFADAELLRENERLKQQVASLQNQLMRAQEVSLISSRVVDSRITYRDGKQFVEYKLQIETNTRGTLYVWHRYSTFRNLAATLQSKNGYKRKEIPELPSKQLFGNFSEKVIQDRVERLNLFLDAATKADYLQWGIRVDHDTCVYKRRVKSTVSRDSVSLDVAPRESESRSRFSFLRGQAA